MPWTPSSRTVSTAAFLALVIGLGLLSRAGGVRGRLPGFVAEYAGDVLWAVAAFLGVRLLAPRWPTARVAAVAGAVAVAVEASQLYHPPWLDRVRADPVAHLFLGDTFAWSDLACYAAGVGLGVALDRTRGTPRADGC